MYFVLTKLSSPSESWTFSTRERALEFVNKKLCWGCKQLLRNKITLEHNPVTDSVESIVYQDELDTDCGSAYRIEQISQDEYRRRAEQAIQEMTKVFETVEEPVGYATKEQNEDLSQENDKSNRMD